MTVVAPPARARGRLVLAGLLPALGLAMVAFVAVSDPQQAAEEMWQFAPVLLVIVCPGVVGFLILRRDLGNRIGGLPSAHSALVGVGLGRHRWALRRRPSW